MTDPRFEGKAIPDPGFADDDGTADPGLLAALAALAAGQADHAALLRRLSSARLLVPVVAVLEEAETGEDGLRRDKTSSMASVTVEAPDGTRSLLAFTSTEALRAWRPDARPIAADGRRVAQAALAEGARTLVVDLAGPVPFGVTGAELTALALAADPAVPVPADPQVAAAVAAVCADEPAVLACVLAPARPSGVRVTLVVDDTIPLPQFRALVPRVTERLAAHALLRARAGALQVAVVPPHLAPPAGDGVEVFRRAWFPDAAAGGTLDHRVVTVARPDEEDHA